MRWRAFDREIVSRLSANVASEFDHRAALNAHHSTLTVTMQLKYKSHTDGLCLVETQLNLAATAAH